MKTPLSPDWSGWPILLVTILNLALLSACHSLQIPAKTTTVTSSGVRLYLQPLPQEAQHINFSITQMAALRDDGTKFLLTQNFIQIVSQELINTQNYLAMSALPAGSYRGLLISLGQAEHLGKEGPATLQTQSEPLFVEQAFEIAPNKSQTLFLSLKPNDLLSNTFQFTPAFYLTKPVRTLKTLMGFVSKPDEHSILVINKHTMQIANTILLRDAPRGMALDQSRNLLYVALGSASTIAVLEVDSTELIGQIPLGYGVQPDELVLSPAGGTLIAADYGSRTISLIDTSTLTELANLSFPLDINDIVLHPKERQIYVFHARAQSISIIDLTLKQIISTQQITEKALTGSFNTAGDQLFVIAQNSPNLTIMHPATLAVINRIPVGFDVTAVKADSQSGLVYVGKRSGEIAVIEPLSLMAIDSFQSAGKVDDLVIDHYENTLYALSSEQARMQKLDLVSGKMVGTVEAGADSYDLVLMNQR